MSIVRELLRSNVDRLLAGHGSGANPGARASFTPFSLVPRLSELGFLGSQDWAELCAGGEVDIDAFLLILHRIGRQDPGAAVVMAFDYATHTWQDRPSDQSHRLATLALPLLEKHTTGRTSAAADDTPQAALQVGAAVSSALLLSEHSHIVIPLLPAGGSLLRATLIPRHVALSSETPPLGHGGRYNRSYPQLTEVAIGATVTMDAGQSLSFDCSPLQMATILGACFAAISIGVAEGSLKYIASVLLPSQSYSAAAESWILQEIEERMAACEAFLAQVRKIASDPPAPRSLATLSTSVERSREIVEFCAGTTSGFSSQGTTEPYDRWLFAARLVQWQRRSLRFTELHGGV